MEPLTLPLSRGERELAGAWLKAVTIVGEELRHFWQGFGECMPMPRGQRPLGKDAKIGVQDAASSRFFELFQKRNSHFHS